jgi:toxin ParE1/3/4
MSRRVRLEPEAEAEIESAMAWYEQKRPGLGAGFLDEVHRSLESLRSPAPACGPVPGVSPGLGVKRLLVKRFPYSVVLVEEPGAVRILAVAHGRRRPGYWRERL